MTDKQITKTIEFILDGKTVHGTLGETIIQVADRNGVYIPRFCYHERLSVAANCRMCLVSVNNGHKTQPACHVQIAPDMIVDTRSQSTRQSQHSIMEFLLINHPLDCPICDQGGECELQDTAMAFGRGVSRYTERKRAVVDADYGPLVASDMTRCIHCTRCVRFGTEIAGVADFTMASRGENMHIETYLHHGLQSELSGNVIDLCPVGALTSKPMRYRGRSWSFINHPYVSAHDGLLSHVYVHTHSHEGTQKIMRVVPRKNESVNQVWLSDRDRFGYLGLTHPERLSHPMIRDGKQWKQVSWDVALSLASERIQSVLKEFGPQQMGALLSPNVTVEEGFICQKLMNACGCVHVDFRQHQKNTDYIHNTEIAFKSTFLDFDVIEQSQVVLLVGSHLRHEQPIAAMRVRQAQQRTGLKAVSINPVAYAWNFDIAEEQTVAGTDFVHFLGAVVLSLGHFGKPLSDAWCKNLYGISRNKSSDAIAKMISTSTGVMLVGQYAQSHPQASTIHRLCVMIEAMTRVDLVYLTPGANATGLELIGCGPSYRDGDVHIATGHSSYDMFDQQKKLYLLHNIEPEYDCYDPSLALTALKKAETVIAVATHVSPEALEYADVLLPAAAWTEYSGTWVSVLGEICHFSAIKSAHGDSKSAWKVYRVLANLLKLKGFSYHDIHELRRDIDLFSTGVEISSQRQKSEDVKPPLVRNLFPKNHDQLSRIAKKGIYRQDEILRRSTPLQAAQDGFSVSIHPDTLSTSVKDGDLVLLKQGLNTIQCAINLDERVAIGGVVVPAGYDEVVSMSGWCDPIEVVVLSEVKS